MTVLPKILLPTLAAWFFLFITGCSGFHLRSPIHLSPALQKPYLETASPYSPLSHALLEAFRLSGATPVDTPRNASIIFAILGDQRTQTLLSVSSTQSSRQYRLSLIVTYQLISPKGKLLTGPETVTESRVLTMASDQILSSSNEINTLYHQIRIAVVHDIMNRLASHEISDILSGSKHRTDK